MGCVRLQGCFELLLRFGVLALAQEPQSDKPIRVGLPHSGGLPCAKLGEKVQFTRRAQPVLPSTNQLVEKPRRLGILAQFLSRQRLVVPHLGRSGSTGSRLLEMAQRFVRVAFGLADDAEEITDLGEPVLAAAVFGSLETFWI